MMKNVVLMVALISGIGACDLVKGLSPLIGDGQGRAKSIDKRKGTITVFEAKSLPAEKAAVPKIEGKATGKMLPFNRSENLWNSLSAHPVPEMWLVFPKREPGRRRRSDAGGASAPTVNVQLPPEAQKAFSEHWKIALAYYYFRLKGKKDYESKIEAEVAMGKSSARLSSLLERIKINVPGGRRVISEREAFELVKLLNSYARSLVPEADAGNIGI